MKKLIMTAASAAVLLSCGTAFASTYDMGNNSVIGAGEGYKTVLITNASTQDIVYIGEADSAYTAAEKFLLKAEPAEGYYTISLGGNEKEKTTTTFYLGMPRAEGEAASARTFNEASGSLAFGWEDIDGKTLGSLILKLGENVYGYDLSGTFIDGAVNVGIEITGIGDNDVSDAKAYINPNTLADITGSNVSE